jgi:hypothetical protein
MTALGLALLFSFVTTVMVVVARGLRAGGGDE